MPSDNDGDEPKGLAKLQYTRKKKIKTVTLPKGKKPAQDFRGRKDNGNGTVSYT